MSETSVRSPASLADLTTLHVGGNARTLVRCPDTDAVVDTVRRLDVDGEPVLIVGGGSNLLIGDDGFAGTAVRIESGDVHFDADASTGRPWVRADAGVVWDDLVVATLGAGYGGLECLSGIPGAAGATPVQNVGAYGVEVADLLRGVDVLDRRAGIVRHLRPDQLGLAYRTSNLKHRNDFVVLTVSFWLAADGLSRPLTYRGLADAVGAADGARADAATVREHVLRIRGGKGMVLDAGDYDTWSAGSFFTNPILSASDADVALDHIRAAQGSDVAVPTYPARIGTADASEDAVKLSAGWLIERAGYARGYPGPAAPARLSTKHTLALTNRGYATAADVLALARDVRDGVHTQFGVTLHPEPVLVNCSL